MFDKLEDLLHRYEEVLNLLGMPDTASDPNRFRMLSKEENELKPIVEAYKAYKVSQQDIEDSLSLLDSAGFFLKAG